MDLDHPEYERFLDARLLQPLDIIMEPGDMLVVPGCAAVTGIGYRDYGSGSGSGSWVRVTVWVQPQGQAASRWHGLRKEVEHKHWG